MDVIASFAEWTARRRALEDALAEIEAGHGEPSAEWKIRYALMLGLERVLSEKPPRLLSGTELRRHQVDALAGMLTELIAASQRDEEPNGNGHGDAADELAEPEGEDDDEDEMLDEAPGLTLAGATAPGVPFAAALAPGVAPAMRLPSLSRFRDMTLDRRTLASLEALRQAIVAFSPATPAGVIPAAAAP